MTGLPAKRERVDFVGIGAPKSGTSWIWQCASEHPEIGLARDKEVWFFADSEARSYSQAGFNYYERGIDWYHQQFKPAKPTARVLGEYTVSYMYDSRTYSRLRDYNPMIKLLVALRSPQNMVYSWYWHNRTGLIANLPETFERAMDIDFVKGLGFYHRALAPFFDSFPSNNIHVVLDDDIKRDPKAVMRSLFGFLGVDSGFQPPSTRNRINPSKVTRFRWLQNFGNATYNALSRVPFVEGLMRSRAFERAVLSVYARVNHVRRPYPPMSAETRLRTLELYRNDIDKLERRLGRDLSAWKQPPGKENRL